MQSFDFHIFSQHLFRWLHILAGVIWVGHLYFFNFVNGPFAGTMDADTKKKVVPQLLPRALFWFRWGAAFTWLFGVLLLILIFYAGDIMFDSSVSSYGWNTGSYLMIAFVFLSFFLYDWLAKISSLTKDLRVFAFVCFALIAILIYMMIHIGGFSYRGYSIHLGVMFGTIMAMNVWMRIWPMQKKIITSVKNGTAPDPVWVSLAGMRSKHNTYMSVPLLWTMISEHTASSMNYPQEYSWLYLAGIVLLGWLLVYWFYKKSADVKGF